MNDPIHRGGCMLYWAEGTKNRNAVRFCNSDMNMVRLFADFLRATFSTPDRDMTIALNVYLGNGLSLENVEDVWLDALALPRTSLRKPQVNQLPTSNSGLKVNRLPHGVCTLRVARSTWMVQHIYGAIQEYAGFEEPAWLG